MSASHMEPDIEGCRDDDDDDCDGNEALNHEEEEEEEDATLHSMLLKACKKYPHHTAVIYDDGCHGIEVATYKEALDGATLLTSFLKSCLGPTQEAIIGLFAEPSISLPSFILGILQMPAAFAPLDPHSPVSVSEQHIRNLGISTICVQGSLLDKFLDGLGQCFSCKPYVHPEVSSSLDIVVIKLRNSKVRNGKCTNGGDEIPSGSARRHETSLAYVLHTSGTTGEPKSVRVPHRCIVPNIAHLRQTFSITQNDVVFMASPLTFDPSIVEMFIAWTRGASLLVVPPGVKMAPRSLAQALMRNHVTVLQVTPSLVSRFTSSILTDRLLGSDSTIRILALGGESCPPPATLACWRGAGNHHTQFYNLYGITEVSSWASCFKIPEEWITERVDVSVPLGDLLKDTVIEVRDERGFPITSGTGEAFLGGCDRVCYLDEEAAVHDGSRVMRSTGDLVEFTNRGLIFVGRSDAQIKRHGKRMSLSSVKRAIDNCPDVSSCCVIHVDEKLIAFYTQDRTVKDKNASIPTDSLSMSSESSDSVPSRVIPGLLPREALRSLRDGLPSHAFPDRFLALTELPVTRHGKVDASALRDLYQRLSEEEKEHGSGNWITHTMKECRDILLQEWKNSLNLDQTVSIAADDSFIAQGGDSFQALRLVQTLEQVLGIDLPDLLDVLLHQSLDQVWDSIRHHMQQRKPVPHCTEPIQTQTLVTQPCGYDSERLNDEHNEKSLTSEALHSESEFHDKESDKDYEHSNWSVELHQVNMKGSFRYLRTSNQKSSKVYENGSTDITRTKAKLDCRTNLTNDDECVETLATTRTCMKDDKSTPSDVKVNDSRINRVLDDIQSDGVCLKRKYDTSDTNNSEAGAVEKAMKMISTSIAACHSCHTEKKEHSMTPASGGEYRISVGRGSQYLCHHCAGRDISARPCSHLECEPESLLDSRKLADSVDMTEVWSVDTGKCVDASPTVLCQRSGSVVFIGSHSHRFLAVCGETGLVLWETVLGDRVESTACLSSCGKYVIVGCYDHYIYTLCATTGATYWKYGTSDVVKCTPVCDPQTGLVYVGSHDQHMVALDVQEKRCRWRKHCGGGSVFASPCPHAPTGSLYAATLKGWLTSFDKDTGQKKWSFHCRKPVFSSPAVTSEGVLAGCVDGVLYCLSHSGCQLWTYTAGGPIFSSLCLHTTSSSSQSPSRDEYHRHGLVVFGSHDGCVTCLDPSDGRPEWTTQVSTSPVYSTPFVFAQGRYLKLAVASTAGTLFILDLHSGKVVTELALPGEVFSSPVVMGDRLVVGCRNDQVYCFSLGSKVIVKDNAR